ncbi:MAG: ABC transporter ATP-binding protein [Burkholderiaceae bacterium]|nr:ABC transporter ATP-binding protein [Burkholderiaceae bacterium]
MLEVADLRVRYGNLEVVHGVSFRAEPGEITAILGGNGAGKTTVLKALMGLVPTASGTITFGTQNLTRRPPHAIARSGLAMCPEGRQVFPRMSVYENLLMGAYLRSDAAGIQEDIEKMFERFPRLSERRLQPAGTLSGGEQEMLAIARALMARPALLLFDEPSWGLAPLIVEEVSQAIRDIKERGTTILLVEQNVQMALGLARYAYILETGEIAMQGSSEELIANSYIKNAYLGV